MQLNKTKLNISVALAVLCDLGGKVFNIRAHWYSSVAQSSLFSDNSAISRNLFMRNEPNFNESEFTASPCGSGAYNDSQTKTKNGTNPNKPNFFTTSNPNFNTELFRESLGLQKNLFMQSKPNFKNQENTASTCKRETYPNLHQQTNQKSKPNPNPIQTQSKPNPNPKPISWKKHYYKIRRDRNIPIGYYLLALEPCWWYTFIEFRF